MMMHHLTSPVEEVAGLLPEFDSLFSALTSLRPVRRHVCVNEKPRRGWFVIAQTVDGRHRVIENRSVPHYAITTDALLDIFHEARGYRTPLSSVE